MSTMKENNLDLLGTLHYVLGVLTALSACIPFIYLFIGLAMIGSGTYTGSGAPRVFGAIFLVLSTILIIGGWVMAVLIIITGTRLKQKQSYNFCLVIAFIECLIVPLGTILGIFTVINLSKEDVKALFG
ncbi:MAG: hypothetical protein SVV67_02710 [Bacillota bacterium]|nr:hypothetical protein [Bacillota bacterium]